MRVTTKGQVTIPLAIREKLGIRPGTELDFELDDEGARLRRRLQRDGARTVARMRGSGRITMSTDEIMALTREPR